MWDKILHANRIASLRDRKNYRGYIESREVVRYVLEHRDEKIMYNFITDQHPYFKTKEPMKVEFMHQECNTMKAAAELAHKLGMSVCFLSMPRERRGLYKIDYITVCEDASTMSPEQIMNRFRLSAEPTFLTVLPTFFPDGRLICFFPVFIKISPIVFYIYICQSSVIFILRRIYGLWVYRTAKI